MLKWEKISNSVRGVVLILFSAAPLWAVDIDIPISATADCLKNNYMSVELRYQHGPAQCHKTEGIWTGDFLNTGQTEVCRPPAPPSPNIGQCNNNCCFYCGGDSQTHKNPLPKIAKPAAPGVYRQSIALTGEDGSLTADIRVEFSADGVFGSPTCASGLTAAQAPNNDSVNFLVTIPDEGQTIRLEKDSATDNQEVLVGQSVTVRARVLRGIWSNGSEQDETVNGQTVIFTAKSPSGAVIGTIQAISNLQGPAEVLFVLNSGDGAYTIDATCSACSANPNVTFTATAKPIETILELLPGEEGGSGQRELVGTLLPLPLRVRVKDTDGTLRAGVEINFSEVNVPAPGQFSDTNPITNLEGIASTYFTLGSATGKYNLRAFCSICASNPGDSKPIVVEGKDRKSKAKSKTPNKPASSSSCVANILKEDEDPESLPQPLPVILACENADTRLRCLPNADHLMSEFSCQEWLLQPDDGTGELKAPNIPADERDFVGTFPQTYAIGARAKGHVSGESPERRCTAIRKVSVGSIELGILGVKPESVLRNGIEPGTTIHIKVPITDASNVSVSDYKHYIQFTAEPAAFARASFVAARPGSVVYVVEFAKLPFVELPFKVILRAVACMSEAPSRSLQVVTQ